MRKLLPCLVLAVLARSAAGQELPPDLAAVPGRALAFVHVRVAELWKGDAGKDLRALVEKIDPKNLRMLDERFVPAPSTIERVTLIVTVKPDKPLPSFLVVVATSAPVDRHTLLTQSLPNAKEIKAGGATYHLDEKLNIAVQVISDRVLIFGENDAVKEYAARPDKGNGVFAAALRTAAGKPAITAGLNTALLPADSLAQVPAELQPLLKSGVIELSLDASKAPTLAIRAQFPDEGAAIAGEKAAKDGIGMARQGLAELRNQANDALKAPKEGARSSLEDLPQAAVALAGLGFINQVEEVLNNLALKRSDNSIAARVTIPEGPFARSVTTLPVAMGLLLPAVQKVREAAARQKSSNNMKQIALAFHNYASVYGKLPTAAITDKNGKPLLSWRVAILPYIEQDNLYKQFHLDEPWDSPHNIKLARVRVKIYEHPAAPEYEMPSTHYQVFVGPGTIFQLNKGLTLEEISAADGVSNTVWLAEAEKAVPWTKPEDIEYDGKSVPKVGNFWRGRVLVGLADGAVRLVGKASEKAWHAALGWNDGQPFDPALFMK